METRNKSEYIKKIAMDFDRAIEKKDIDKIPFFFTKDCEIELLGLTLIGENGIKKWINWLYKYIDKIRFEPITIMVNGNIFFEEFVLNATLKNGARIKSK
jgi:ketosteroid isomerase-like protein